MVMIATYTVKMVSFEDMKRKYPNILSKAMDIYQEGDIFYIQCPPVAERVVMAVSGAGLKADCHIVMKRNDEVVFQTPLGKNVTFR
jgi:uncharacterized UPF0146 family protein